MQHVKEEGKKNKQINKLLNKFEFSPILNKILFINLQYHAFNFSILQKKKNVYIEVKFFPEFIPVSPPFQALG